MTIPIIKLDGTQYPISKGQKVTLKCQVSSWMNTATVTWIRLYKELEIKLTPGKSLKYSGGTSDNGLYWCEAINSSGLSRSDDVQLDIFDGNVIGGVVMVFCFRSMINCLYFLLIKYQLLYLLDFTSLINSYFLCVFPPPTQTNV
jgi:hypothetical protein